jgi:hypothetical protein
MARSRVSSSPGVHRSSLARRLLLGAVYLLAISGLIAWELRDHFEEVSSSCANAEIERPPSAYTFFYKWLLRHASEESVNQVSIIAFPENLEDIHTNLCLGRSYMADVLRAVASQNPSVIVIDRFYGPVTCKSFPETTNELTKAIQSIQIPVIVGESSTIPDRKLDGACLVREPQLDFESPYVHRGLVRSAIQLEKVPLEWPIANSEGPSAKAEEEDSLSWAAVKAYDKAYAQRDRLQKLLNAHSHPYADLTFDLPRQTSTQLLCEAGTAEMKKRWSVDCSQPTSSLNLLGKIVLIGSEGQPDQHMALGVRMWGLDIQAHYIQVLLSGHYLRALPNWIGFAIFALFVFIIEGVPTLLEAFRPHWRKHPFLSHAFQKRRYIWVVLCTLLYIAATSFVTFGLGYLPPLVVFGDMFLVVVTRLLFFLAESTEIPLIHKR